MDYTEFFRKQLGPAFRAIFVLAEGAPPWDELNNPSALYEYTRTLNLPPWAPRRSVTKAAAICLRRGDSRSASSRRPSATAGHLGRAVAGPGLTGPVLVLRAAG